MRALTSSIVCRSLWYASAGGSFSSVISRSICAGLKVRGLQFQQSTLPHCTPVETVQAPSSARAAVPCLLVMLQYWCFAPCLASAGSPTFTIMHLSMIAAPGVEHRERQGLGLMHKP